MSSDFAQSPVFVPVADVASLPPGAGRTVHVRGKEFALYNVEGTFYAVDDACPHRGAPLGAGCLQNGRIFCPLHGWEFDPA
ncbi:MAG TPA: Rieske (2Fe-2S) protein, partial [Verrucomicrobiae bacterium]|nr:Rieske (2Fe-2S) protein [Verrucomicrobiae bacterium]